MPKIRSNRNDALDGSKENYPHQSLPKSGYKRPHMVNENSASSSDFKVLKVSLLEPTTSYTSTSSDDTCSSSCWSEKIGVKELCDDEGDGQFVHNVPDKALTLSSRVQHRDNGTLPSQCLITPGSGKVLIDDPALMDAPGREIPPRVLANSQLHNTEAGGVRTRCLHQHGATPSLAVMPNIQSGLTAPFTIKQRRKTWEPTGPDHFTRISDEMVLMIFSWLTRRSLAKCLRICKRWHRIGLDESLWKKIDLAQKTVQPKTMEFLITKRTAYLRLFRAFICGAGIPELPSISGLRYLDLSCVTIQVTMLHDLLIHCRMLRKISMESLQVNDAIIQALAQNSELETVNLAMCYQNCQSNLDLRPLIMQCTCLQHVNFAWVNMTRECVAYLCSHMPPTLRSLNFSGCRHSITDYDVEQLVQNCKQLEDLDLSDSLDLTESTVENIQQNLPRLRALSLSRCYNIDIDSFRELKSMDSLRQLNVMGMMNDFLLTGLRNLLHPVEVNEYPLSTIARPTVDPHVRSIWGLRV